jgi:hypothetical protein
MAGYKAAVNLPCCQLQGRAGMYNRSQQVGINGGIEIQASLRDICGCAWMQMTESVLYISRKNYGWKSLCNLND